MSIEFFKQFIRPEEKSDTRRNYKMVPAETLISASRYIETIQVLSNSKQTFYIKDNKTGVSIRFDGEIQEDFMCQLKYNENTFMEINKTYLSFNKQLDFLIPSAMIGVKSINITGFIGTMVISRSDYIGPKLCAYKMHTYSRSICGLVTKVLLRTTDSIESVKIESANKSITFNPTELDYMYKNVYNTDRPNNLAIILVSNKGELFIKNTKFDITINGNPITSRNAFYWTDNIILCGDNCFTPLFSV